MQRVRLTFLSFFCLVLAFPTHAALDSLRVPKPRSEYDISHDYHVKLLTLALQEVADNRKVPSFTSEFQMSQGRAAAELIKGKLIDIYWLGTDIKTEKSLRAIRVPTTRGLIGYRKFIIHQASAPKFAAVSDVEDLRKLTACQGTHWPDTGILSSARLSVTTSTIYENLFKMVNNQRCDYFPRGYHDYQNELVLRAKLYPNLVSFNDIMLHYPFAVYYFTRKDNDELANWVEEGLLALAKKGKIIDFMREHPLTAHIFPLPSEQHSVYINIPNPLLPSDTDIHNSALWFQPEDFKIQNRQRNSLTNLR